jgi:hypothetical protein
MIKNPLSYWKIKDSKGNKPILKVKPLGAMEKLFEIKSKRQKSQSGGPWAHRRFHEDQNL